MPANDTNPPRLFPDPPAVQRVTPEPRTPSIVRVVIGRKVVARLPAPAADRLGIQPGTPWTKDLAAAAAHAQLVHLARRKAVSLLRIRSRSRADVTARLEARGYSAAVAREAVDGLEGLIDDQAVARGAALAATRTAPVSTRLLKDRVRRTGAEAPAVHDAVREALDGRSEAELAAAAAQTLARRVPASLGPAARLRRLAGALQRRGFDAELALEAASRALGVPMHEDVDTTRADYDD